MHKGAGNGMEGLIEMHVDFCKDEMEKGDGMHGQVVNMHVNACFDVLEVHNLTWNHMGFS